MGYIICPECGERVENTLMACTRCGYPFPQQIKLEENVMMSKVENQESNIVKQKTKDYIWADTMSVVFCIICIISLVCGIVFMRQGFDKKNNYYNSENYTILNENAYVGGDAYNYIINGTYFTGYVVLAGSMFTIFTISLYATIQLSIYKYKMEREDKKNGTD